MISNICVNNHGGILPLTDGPSPGRARVVFEKKRHVVPIISGQEHFRVDTLGFIHCFDRRERKKVFSARSTREIAANTLL